MALKKVNKNMLKESVAKNAPNLSEKAVFIVGARAIKNGQIEVEFAQHRALAGRKANLFGMLNEGDKRFNSGKTTMRVWLMVNETGFKNIFRDIKDLDFSEVVKECRKLEDDERVAILKPVETINVSGTEYPVKIICKETIETSKLPKSIRELVEDEGAEEEYKQRYILQTGGEDSERIVDEFGNIVYRYYELDYGDSEDSLVENKILHSEFKERKNKSTEKSTKENSVLENMEKDLVG